MNFEIILASLTFLVAIFWAVILTNWWIRIAKKNKLQGKDMNKHSKPLVAEAGGIAVISAIIFSILFYIFLKTFILKSDTNLVNLLVISVTVLLAGYIGFIDDILGWKKGLKQWQKLLMTLPIAIPLIVINAGHQTMSLPFFGVVNFGLLYPLILIPLAIVGTSNGYNILAGYNGLEAGLGIIIFGALAVISLITGQLWLAMIAGIIICALIGFLLFNKYPAKVFPGDSLTYSLGALVACFAILGNIEKSALILFIPFILEGFLKLRSKLKAENFGLPNKDGSLEAPYKESYSLTHVALKMLKKIKPGHRVYEKDVVYFILIIELMCAVLAVIPIL